MSELGDRLRRGGLTPRALAAWAGTDRLSAVPDVMSRLAGRPLTPSSTLLALFVAGDEVPVGDVPGINELRRAGLADVRGESVGARVAVLPLGPSLMICDRLDTDDSLDLVCWPDDSSYHLARSVPPGRRARWLDLGCGSAFAPLMRPELAHAIVASDINRRAIRYARLGAELSGITHITTHEADLAGGVPAESYDLVTCNAPIPQAEVAPDHARWLVTDNTFVARLFAQASECIAPDGGVVVHAALDALLPVVEPLRGERVVVSYTPPETRAFAIAWWRPSAADRLVVAHRELSVERPHLTYEDRLAAVAGTLPG